MEKDKIREFILESCVPDYQSRELLKAGMPMRKARTYNDGVFVYWNNQKGKAEYYHSPTYREALAWLDEQKEK